jgi:hypothetical protein
MHPPSTTLPEVITAKLRGFARRRSLAASAGGLADAVLGFSLGLLAIGLIEWLMRPGLTVRIGLSACVFILGAVLLMRRSIVPWIRPISWRDTAQDFEVATQKRFQERILSAVELADSGIASNPGISTWMAGQTIRLAAEEMGPVKVRDWVDFGPARKAWQRTAVFLLALAVGCVIPGFVSVLWLAVNPSASTAVWSRTVLTVAPGHCEIIQDASLEIRARTTPLAHQTKAMIRWNDGFQETALMTRDSTNGFALRLPSVPRGFQYSIQAGDAESMVFSVRVLTPPAIARMRVHLEPPAYALETNRVIEGGNADFLAGSRVRLVLESAGESIAQADWLPEASAPRSFAIENHRLSVESHPTNATTYRVRLIGVNRLKTEPAQKWQWRPLADAPPRAQLTAMGLEAGLVQRDEILPLSAEASDDVGLKKIELLVLGKDALVVQRSLYSFLPDRSATNRTAKLREYKSSINFALTNLDPATGDELQFQVIATDLKDQTTRSEPITITIGARDKALEARAVTRLRPMLATLDAQMDYLRQTRSSWLSLGRNYREDDPTAQRPALAVLRGRLDEFNAALETVGSQLVSESATNGLPDARFLYRLGSTLAAWGPQQREIMLDNCGRLEQQNTTNVNDWITLGRELFSRALFDLANYRRALGVFTGALETDVLATQCESAQGRYQRGLAVLRGDLDAVGRGPGNGPGLRATFSEGTSINSRPLEQRVTPPTIAPPSNTNSVQTPAVMAALKDRVRSSLTLPATVPPALSPLTNEVRNQNLPRMVREKLAMSEALAQRLTPPSAWESIDLQLSETQADDLVGLAREARRILREELEQYRWRYEGAAALKEVQIAINELRDTVQDLRLLPYHARTNLTEAELAKLSLAKAWEKELEKATERVNHQFFETAKQKDATLAERNAALRAAEKTRKELRPAITKLDKKLQEILPKGELMLQIDRRVDEIHDRYRELNELQEKMNREHIAAEARRAFPEVRAFALAQKSTNPPDLTAPYLAMKHAVAEVQKSQWIVGDYRGAEKLTTLEGHAPANAKGKELVNEIRGLASSTDNNPPSLAQNIPPPMKEQTEALDTHAIAPQASAEELALPRLAMALEAARLQKQGDRPSATAYAFLGQDLGELLVAPDQLNAPALKPLSDRAAALAGQKGEPARQAEIKAASERLRALANTPKANPEAVAARLEALSALSQQAAGEAKQRPSLTQQLNEMTALATPLADWTESNDPLETAASAANESLQEIQAAPKQWESYHDASQILADAARQVRMEAATRQLGALNPFPEPEAKPGTAKLPALSPMPSTGSEALAGKVPHLQAPAGTDQADWARLSDRLRQAIRSSGIENFSEEQQTFIRAYFERLSSDP